VFCTILLTLGAYKFIFQNPKNIDYELEQIQNTDPTFTNTFQEIKNTLSGTEFNLKLYQALSLSDDPLAQHALVKSASYTEKYEERAEAEKFLFERARRQNLNETVRQIEEWCKLPEHYLHPYYLKILTFLEPSIPFEERINLITELNQADRDLAKSLTTAIAFDTKQLEQYQAILQKLIIQNQGFKNTENISTLALVMLDPHLSSLFEDSINLYRDQLKDSDLLILFENLALRNDINTRVVANLILKKGLLDNLASLPLQILIEKESLDSSVVRTLARVSLNNLTENDISALRSWYAIESEQTLLVVLTKSANKDLLLEAIDALVGKSPVLQPSAGILQWIRKYAWEERVTFAKVLGVLGLADRIDQDIVLQTLYSLDNYITKPEFLELLLSSNSPALLEYLLTRHGQLIDIGIKINLLKHTNSKVRGAAVESIDTNDLIALRLVVSTYDTEKDPEVREKYNRFWMIKERENKLRDNNATNQ
jgi:hypothetical protein